MAGLTDNDERQSGERAPDASQTASSDDAADEATDDATFEVSQLEPRRRVASGARWGRWRRPLIGALTGALLVAVAVGLFVRSTSDPGAALASLLGVAPKAEPATTDDAFAAAHGVPWGVLTISGQRMSSSAMAGDIFQLTPGAHTIEYRASGFPTLRCVISVPRAARDTCPLARATDVSDTPQAYSATRLLDLQATPDRLSATQRAALLAAISHALEANGAVTTIAPGELYLDADGNTQRASEPLTYRATPELATFRESQQHISSLGGPPCGNVCASGIDLGSALTTANQSGWRLDIMMKLTPTVSDTSGRSFTQGQTDGVDISTTTLMVTRADDGWQVAPGSAGPVDISAQSRAMFCPSSLPASLQGGAGIDAVMLTLLPSDPADGCVVAIIPAGADPSGANVAAKAIVVIDRFGVMQTVNASAHMAFASLPLADANAQAIAMRTLRSAILSVGAAAPGNGATGA